MKSKATLACLGLTVTISTSAAFAHGGHGSFNSSNGWGQSSHSGSGCYQAQTTCNPGQNVSTCSNQTQTTPSCYHLPLHPQPVTCITHHHSPNSCPSSPPPPPTAVKLAQEGIQDLHQALSQFQDARTDLRQARLDQIHATREHTLYTRLERIGNHDVCAGNALCKEGGKFTHLGQLLLKEGNACLDRAQQLNTQGNKDKCAANNWRNEAACDIKEGLEELNEGLADLSQANAQTPQGQPGFSAGLKAEISDGLQNLQKSGNLATKASNDMALANASGTSSQQAAADRAAASAFLGRATFLSKEGTEDMQNAYAGIPDND